MDFKSEVNNVPEKLKQKYKNRLEEVTNIYKKIKPVRNSIEAITELSDYYDVYILSTALWNNP
jgi:5'-nucleotidase